MTMRAWRLSFCLMLGAALASGGEKPQPEYALHGTTDKPVAIYQPGEEMVFTLKVLEDGKPVAGKKVKWTRNGDDGQRVTGEAVATVDGVPIKTKIAKPGFVRIVAEALGEDGKKLQGFRGGWGGNQYGDIFFEGGACAAPDKLTPGGEEPADFDKFWEEIKADVAAVPMAAEVKELKTQSQNKLYAVKIPCAGPRPVTGYLSVPAGAKEKSLKAVVSFDGYGVHPWRPQWFVQDALHFHVNAHGMELEQSKEYYDQLTKELANYAFKMEENVDRKTAYFYGMACRLLRAFEYIKTRPEWNGKDLASDGGSQGGTQGLWGAAMVPGVTSAEIWSPGFCDLAGVKIGRLRGWRPDWTKALDYYDPVFVAKRIKTAKVHLIANYGDYTCPPSGVWIVYNNLATPKKSMEVKQGARHDYTMKDFQSYVVTPDGIKDVQVKK